MFPNSGDAGGTHLRIERNLYLVDLRYGVSFFARSLNVLVFGRVSEVSALVRVTPGLLAAPVHRNRVGTFVDVVVAVVATAVGMVAVVAVGKVTSELVIAAAVAVVDTGVAAVVVGQGTDRIVGVAAVSAVGVVAVVVLGTVAFAVVVVVVVAASMVVVAVVAP